MLKAMHIQIRTLLFIYLLLEICKNRRVEAHNNSALLRYSAVWGVAYTLTQSDAEYFVTVQENYGGHETHETRLKHST